MADKAEVILIGAPKKLIVDGLQAAFNLHIIPRGPEAEAAIAKVASEVGKPASAKDTAGVAHRVEPWRAGPVG